MKTTLFCIFWLVESRAYVGAEPVVEGRVRLPSGAPVAGAQVRLFDLTDPRTALAGTDADESGYFDLAIGALLGSALPEGFELGANYPNPFNPSTFIPYQLPAAMHVRLDVFNILGQRIATLVDEEQKAGFHTATWDATNAAGQAVGAGVYLYRLRGAGAKITRSMVLIDGPAGIGAGEGKSIRLGTQAGPGVDGETAPVYGLTVSSPGLIPYIDPAFRVEAGLDPLDLLVQAPDQVSLAKVALGGVLGDVDNTGRVDFVDALLVAVYSLDPTIILPNNGDISLGDVDNDGGISHSDARLISAHLRDPSDPSLPSGIGEPVVVRIPDLIMKSVSVSDTSLAPGHFFTFSATVRNLGTVESAPTALDIYRSTDATISNQDTIVRGGLVGALAASDTSSKVITLAAPSEEGTYYYGACVAAVRDESDTSNNCSSGLRVIVQVQDVDLVNAGPQIYNDNIFILPISEDLAVDWASFAVLDITQRFYDHFEDEFDFLLVVRNLIYGVDIDRAPYGFFIRVSNNVQGIGLRLFSRAQMWGSSGKLQGVGYFPFLGFPNDDPRYRWTPIGRGPGIHELLHRWANFVVPTVDGGHWGFSSANGLLGGFHISRLVDHGSNRYTAGEFWTNGSHSRPFSPIELYLAGFIPPEEVPDLWVAEDGKWERDSEGEFVLASDGDRIFTASRIRTYTIEDIIAEHGPRVPDSSQSQRNFRAAIILVTDEKHPATRQGLERLSEDASWTSHPAFTSIGDQVRGNSRRTRNFFESTGGRATITMDELSHFQRDASAKRLAPSSFGTPPLPVVDRWE